MKTATKPMIDILLATYNGEAFLPEQLDSLLRQTSGDWRLLVRDDGSNDKTLEVLEAYRDRFSGKLSILSNQGTRLGPGGNFSELLQHSAAEYIMFCDQDDIWFPEKIDRTLAEMRRLEGEHGPDSPCLVFSDVTVVDEQLRVVAPSGWRSQNADPVAGTRLSRLVLMNPGNGCTMMLNRALLTMATPIPAEALMHDYWLALVATAFGHTGVLRTPTLYYRQHGRNELGNKRWGKAYVFNLLGNLSAAREAMERHRRQAQAFYQRYHDGLKDGDRKALAAYVRLPEKSFWRKRLDIVKHGIFYVGTLRNVGWFLLV